MHLWYATVFGTGTEAIYYCLNLDWGVCRSVYHNIAILTATISTRHHPKWYVFCCIFTLFYR
jgi:hypothetical protein